ncbi:hypothetical protein [Streptomyces sp. ITFR-6]|uniref:hypothetical protein n=1 Tax=Streptomyces sp. ITFR-6 TaxID=3075197 RepID=UPI00288B4DAF|nr:hypothetical protein [Streptomyces sp. ITFR-6]WNI28455.1 hypothetical protein RLT59_06430 [Streptomyces sp. ITFR-6]
MKTEHAQMTECAAEAARIARAVAAWSDPAVWESTIGGGDSASPAADIAEMLA